jgi:hypothetical protein
MQHINSDILKEDQENAIKLTLPGMRSKGSGAPPPLERLESLVSSPCISDSTLTSRRLREMIPCTPSPMYSYEVKFGNLPNDSNAPLAPRFFPFPAYTQQVCQTFPSTPPEYNQQNGSPVDSASTGRISSSPTFLISPGSRGGADTHTITTPIAENILAEEHAANEGGAIHHQVPEPDHPSELLTMIKQFILPNGNIEIPKDIHLNHVLEEVVELSKDQVGSRFLQQALDSKIFNASQLVELTIRMVPATRTMSVDAFGNYVVQKLIDAISLHSRCQLLEKLTGSMDHLSVHMYGCRVVQKLIETTGLEQQLIIARELRGHVVKCVEDQNGNHVIQKLIEYLPSKHLLFIVDEFLGNIPVMAIHCYGCRVVQRLLEKLCPEESLDLVNEILANLWQLSQDQYGNYVVQHVLLHGSIQHRSVIIQVIASHILEFACHKYASNIAEKALLCSEDQVSKDLLIGSVIGSGGPDSPLHVLMKDRFANYVIQRCIELSHGEQRRTLVNILKVNLPQLKRVIYGKHIATAIERILATHAS